MLDSFFDLMHRGGPVMWPILAASWLAIFLLVERALRYRSWLSLAQRDHTALAKDASHRPALNTGRSNSPIAMMLDQLHWDEVNHKGDLADQLNTQLAQLMPRLEGTMPTIAIIGSLLPMLGLLGTVTGMIEVFDVIALHGTGNAEDMAYGISQALITTAAGLIIAIPVIFAHHLLARQLRKLLAVTEQSMHTLYLHGHDKP